MSSWATRQTLTSDESAAGKQSRDAAEQNTQAQARSEWGPHLARGDVGPVLLRRPLPHHAERQRTLQQRVEPASHRKDQSQKTRRGYRGDGSEGVEGFVD